MPSDTVNGFQTHYRLSEISPDNPVYLGHASGHAGFANAAAMDIAGLLILPKDGINKFEVKGGEVMRDAFGRPTGIFNERAQGLITKHIPETTQVNGKPVNIRYNSSYGGYGYMRGGRWVFYDVMTDMVMLNMLMRGGGYYYGQPMYGGYGYGRGGGGWGPGIMVVLSLIVIAAVLYRSP